MFFSLIRIFSCQKEVDFQTRISPDKRCPTSVEVAENSLFSQARLNVFFSFIAKQQLDDSVVFVGSVSKNSRTDDLFDSTLSKTANAEDLLGSIESQNDLAKLLSPEVTWGEKSLIDFQSPTDPVSENDVPNDFRHEETIGLSMDPLRNFNSRQPLLKHPKLSSIADVSPIQSSTPTNLNVSDDFDSYTTQLSSPIVSSFEY